MLKYVCEKCLSEISSDEVYRVQLSNPTQTVKITQHYHQNCLPSWMLMTLSKEASKAAVPLKDNADIIKPSRSGKAFKPIDQARILAALYLANRSIGDASTICKRPTSTCRNYVKYMTDEISERWSDREMLEWEEEFIPYRRMMNLFANGWGIKDVADEGNVSAACTSRLIAHLTGIVLDMV